MRKHRKKVGNYEARLKKADEWLAKKKREYRRRMFEVEFAEGNAERIAEETYATKLIDMMAGRTLGKRRREAVQAEGPAAEGRAAEGPAASDLMVMRTVVKQCTCTGCGVKSHKVICLPGQRCSRRQTVSTMCEACYRRNRKNNPNRSLEESPGHGEREG